mmetsp:Transcript_71857/g.159803  ORF Transcript_71857/g.159803 Transcript_71857/m.159803 type:complete len:207 (-) Transcript_71857:131-751(-)
MVLAEESVAVLEAERVAGRGRVVHEPFLVGGSCCARNLELADPALVQQPLSRALRPLLPRHGCHQLGLLKRHGWRLRRLTKDLGLLRQPLLARLTLCLALVALLHSLRLRLLVDEPCSDPVPEPLQLAANCRIIRVVEELCQRAVGRVDLREQVVTGCVVGQQGSQQLVLLPQVLGKLSVAARASKLGRHDDHRVTLEAAKWTMMI